MNANKQGSDPNAMKISKKYPLEKTINVPKTFKKTPQQNVVKMNSLALSSVKTFIPEVWRNTTKDG